MKKIRPFILMMLLIAMAASVTACGSSDNNTTQSTTMEATQQSGTAAMDNGDPKTTEGGIIDGVVNDMENGADEMRNGMDDMTGETTGNGSSAATMESGTSR